MPRVVIDRDTCKGCELCCVACPTHVLGMSKTLNTKGFFPAEVVDPEHCTGCKMCAVACPDVAIQVYGKKPKAGPKKELKASTASRKRIPVDDGPAKAKPRKMLMKGCEAIGEAAIRAGLDGYFAYPITPQNEVAEYMVKRMPQVGGAFLQGESEVAVANMLYGAAGAGARVFTTTSSPGFSLMAEGISYIAGAELPCVLVNIMRSGPGLGGILAAQSDYRQATKAAGHGDYRCLVLAPSTVQEAAELTAQAFELADLYRNPVIVLADGMIGQMMEAVDLQKIPQRTDLPRKSWATDGCKGRKPNAATSLWLDPAVLEQLNLRLVEKYKRMVANEVRFELYNTEKPYALLCVAYGTMARICKTAIDSLAAEGIQVGLIRPISLYPFPFKAVLDASRQAEKVISIELSTGQMIDDVNLALEGTKHSLFFGRCGGMIPTPEDVAAEMKRALRGGE